MSRLAAACRIPTSQPRIPHTTGQVMRFVVVSLASKDNSQDPARLTLPAFKPLGPASHTRQVSLNEESSKFPSTDPLKRS